MGMSTYLTTQLRASLLQTPYLATSFSWIQVPSILYSQPRQKTKLAPGYDRQISNSLQPMEESFQCMVPRLSSSWTQLHRDFILAGDFLGHHGLIVDIANRRLLDVTTFRSTPVGSRHWCTEICTVGTHVPYDILCKDFPNVFRPASQTWNISPHEDDRPPV